MKFTLLAASAAAFIAPAQPKAGPLASSKEEMIALAEANPDFLGRTISFWDPLGALDNPFWGIGQEATIGYLRHAEIKHGRVAMAGFLGYCVQSTELVSGEHTILPYKGYTAGLTPPEQWDAIPFYGKIQILTLIGMLESYGEILDPHYCNGGLPGYYPPIKGKRPEIVLNLFDPLDWFPEKTEEQLARGRAAEINNGRLAQFGILSLLSEAVVPGSVPVLQGLIPAYTGGHIMAPFGADFM